ncbi:unnamed protein product [Aspergillus oryzae]|uniref:Calcium-channel protein CCH1 n=1 Tax=Aspergillus oryzae TaxID=5062 RepID=A0AAN4YJH8_ASPOZ|nr:unnamed protein product [Aspergillus oryzae]GMG28138.1 unnamed protein product [Aspergillus oryzae]
MASNSHDRGTNDDSHPTEHSIPLQDLSGSLSHGTTATVGSSFRPGRSLTRRGSNYERLAVDSPVEGPTATQNARQRRGSDAAPVDNPEAFAQAMSSVGLSFDGPTSPRTSARYSRDETGSDFDIVHLDSFGQQEAAHYLSPNTFTDTTPLTDTRNVQPISGAASSSLSLPLDDRSSARTVHFPTSNAGSHLGDDLEGGFSGRRRGGSSATDRARSLSPSASGSALQRASSMMKSMSQRVVNLSNEPEVVEQSILREESQRSARLDAPPSLPSLPGYAHDAPSTSSLDTQAKWRDHNNPLRGKALGILGPSNPIRVKLCDLLVHSFTEPFILVVIVIQMILLTIETARPEFTRSERWGGNPMDYPYFVIFIIYTLELIAKILVSGLILNPAEYSTIDRSLGFRKAFMEKGKNLITPQRQFSTRRPSTVPEQPQASIIRTFTGGLNQLDRQIADDPVQKRRFCGGYINETTGKEHPWIPVSDNSQSPPSAKGYLCPAGSICIENEMPYKGTMNFDNILNSLELVFVIMSSNTFTDLLYYTTDTDYLAAALFFVCGFIILSLWLVNLLVAVITHTFQVIREESKRSAFAVQKLDNVEKENLDQRKRSTLKRFYDKTEWLWVCVITFDLVVQALRTSTMSPGRENLINNTETIVTLILLAEIIMRFASDWRKFHKKRRNWVDLGLVIITCIIQLPPIRDSGRTYTVLTMFQILRVYRVVLAIPITRDLITVVFRNTVGLLNLIGFLFMITFIASIFATQLFRGSIPEDEDVDINFNNIYNSFLGMYQILSSENWTEILYNLTTYTYPYSTAWISATFLILWFIVANFIVLNMFIAVIQESFDVSEDEKRLQQVRAFLKQKHLNGSSQGNLSLSKILRLGRNSDRYKEPLDYGPAALEMLLKDAVVQEFLDEQHAPAEHQRGESGPAETTTTEETGQPGIFSRMWTAISTSIMRKEPNPFYTNLNKYSRANEELDPREMAKEVVSATEQRKRAQREYLMRHPNYNKSLFIFAPDNPIRRLCQRIVGPGRGHQRIEGVDPYKPVWYAFSAFVYAAIIAMVLIACITTPIYQRENYPTRRLWFVYTDMGFAILFTLEALIKVIADGFFWTPNAYFRGSWGFIDGVVLITLWINVGGAMFEDWAVSRSVGAVKALRALRLLNVSDSAKDTFHSVIIVGGWKVIEAAAVSMSFLIPFAIYGVNLFAGQMVTCNDDNVTGSLDECINEYSSSPYNWEVLAPRAASNPFYDFDNFFDSLFILFQIVSQEGWTDVQAKAMSITGVGMQPQSSTAPENGLFFVVFNLLGAVFVLTLFVSVFMRNYTEQTGVAYLTAEQRSWLELRKLLKQVSPSKRSFDKKSHKWKMWCYRIAVKKHGRWARCVSTILVLHILLLVLEYYPEPFIFEFCRGEWLGAMSGKPLYITDLRPVLQRNNQLDQLFKTAAASLTAIGNLLATWLVLFLVFAIAMNQTFGLTKFGGEENNNINFRDIPRSLILLFRMSCGEGWNQVMEDFATMVPPICTTNDDFLHDDCGSAAWARTLFIAWNIISIAIPTTTRGKLSVFCPLHSMNLLHVSCYDSVKSLNGLQELSGVFSMRIYDDEFTIGRILEECRVDRRDSLIAHRRVVDGVDLEKMAKILRRIPVDDVRERRQRLNTFYEEVKVSADPVRGISFHSCLMILAHYNVINDSKSLKLEEFLRRRARLQRVEEAVRRQTVIGFFDTLYWSREFRRQVERSRSARMTAVPNFTVPEIFVDDGSQDDHPHEEVRATVPEAGDDHGESSSQPMLSPLSPTRGEGGPSSQPGHLPRIDTALAGRMSATHSPTEWSSISPSLSPNRPRANTTSSYGDGPDLHDELSLAPERSRQNSAMSAQDVMQSLDDSIWGEKVLISREERNATREEKTKDEEALITGLGLRSNSLPFRSPFATVRMSDYWGRKRCSRLFALSKVKSSKIKYNTIFRSE